MPLYSIKVLYWGAFENVHITELKKTWTNTFGNVSISL